MRARNRFLFGLALASFLPIAAPASADDVVIAQSAAHKLKVVASSAKWCVPHLMLRMLLDQDSPDLNNQAAQAEILGRMKGPITTDCAAALDATVSVTAQGKSLGSFKGASAEGWVFKSVTAQAATAQPVSLDDEPAPAAAKPAEAVMATVPGDAPASHDPAFLRRFSGSQIIAYATRSFDEYTRFVETNLRPEKMEGQVTRIIYKVPVGHTPLELLRNYEDEVRQTGLDITGELLPCKKDYGYLGIENNVFRQNGWENNSNPYSNASSTNADSDGPACYFSARGVIKGQDTGVSVIVVEKHVNLKFGKDINLVEGEILVGVDVVTAKGVANQMVAVKATDIAAALASKGSIDLYGIQFDVDKTDIKPESAKSLDEIATLMKIDGTLKLDISGHTDNTGSVEHNQQLSEGRAKAVVDALVKNYGIDPSRLQAHGFGDTRPVADNATEAGKAKNRRVELRKI